MPIGDMVFAARGDNVPYDYDHCQIQIPSSFKEETEFLGVITRPDFRRNEEKFKHYDSLDKLSSL